MYIYFLNQFSEINDKLPVSYDLSREIIALLLLVHCFRLYFENLFYMKFTLEFSDLRHLWCRYLMPCSLLDNVLETLSVWPLGKEGGKVFEFFPNKLQTEHSNWLRTLVCQSNVLAFFEGQNWLKNRTRKTIFSYHQKFSILCDAIHIKFFTALLGWKSETLKPFGSGIILCRDNFKTKW